jgi:integrase
MLAARTTRVKGNFELDVIRALVAVGSDPTSKNQAIASKLIAEARAAAAREALEPGWIQDWMASGNPTHGVGSTAAGSMGQLRTNDLPDIALAQKLEEPFFLDPTGGSSSPKPEIVMQSPTSASQDPFAECKAEDRRLLEMTPVQLAEEYITQKLGFLDHRAGGKRASKSNVEHTRRQIICAARLLQQSLPTGTPFSLVTAEQVKNFDSHLDHIPLSFGKAAKDHSLNVQLSDVAAATAIRVEEGELSLDDVGLSIPTSNKHFRYLQRMRNELEKLCSKLPPLSYAKYCQPDSKKDRDARVEYTAEQGRAIFGLPPWTGCLSIEERLEKGALIIHDALFWVLLLVWYTGARREEICALRLLDVRSEHGIDYLLIPDGKTENALRHIPIAEELKRLGFLSFVTAMRVAGEHLLFPEIQPGRGKRKLGDVFYKLWWIYLKPMIPGLVRGQAMHSCRHMVSTELKDLQVFPEFRNDLLGHSGGWRGRYSISKGDPATSPAGAR